MPSLSQSMPYRSVSESGSVEVKVYGYEVPETGVVVPEMVGAVGEGVVQVIFTCPLAPAAPGVAAYI